MSALSRVTFGLPVGRCDYDRVAVYILDPKLKVLRVWIDVNVSHDRGFEVTSTGDDVLKVVDFEPEQYAVTDRLCWIADGTMVMIGMPVVQLQDQPITSPLAGVVPWMPQPLILGTTMPSDTAE